MPQLTFTTPRYPTASLPLSSKRLKQRNAIAQEKAAKVAHYTIQQYHCRTQILLAYFGEEIHQKCGKCDICLKKHSSKKEHFFTNYSEYRRLVLQHIREGRCEVRQIVDSVPPMEETSILTTIRQMLDNGELAYDSTNRLYLKDSSLAES